MVESQFLASFENNSNFGQKRFTPTEFRSTFVKTALSQIYKVGGCLYTWLANAPTSKAARDLAALSKDRQDGGEMT
jgi:hypothetical protein